MNPSEIYALKFLFVEKLEGSHMHAILIAQSYSKAHLRSEEDVRRGIPRGVQRERDYRCNQLGIPEGPMDESAFQLEALNGQRDGQADGAVRRKRYGMEEFGLRSDRGTHVFR